MTSFSEVLAARSYLPEKHVILKPNAFADDWQGRPLEDVALGLRRVSDADIQTARAEAAKFAIEMHDDPQGQIEAFNDALMRWLVVRGTCDANDIRTNATLFDGSEENVRNALTSQGIRFLWDAVEQFHIESSPLIKEADEGDVLEFLILMKMPDPLEKLDTGRKKRFRKLLGFLLSELQHDIDEVPEAAITD